VKMGDSLEKYKQIVEEQKEALLEHLARLGIASDFDWEIDLPDEGTPLAELFFAMKIAAENLKLISEERDLSMKELEAQIQIIESQRKAILELSTPVIPIWDEILVLPLIGTVDSTRSRQIMENLLSAILGTQASFAILDITGVPEVDTDVAKSFLEIIESARMLGTEIILTGVSPFNAETLVRLGVDLSRMTTKGSLQAGLKFAFDKTNFKITK